MATITELQISAYLDGLDNVAAFQRRVLQNTPLAPLAELPVRQAELARELAGSFLTAGARVARESTETVAEAVTGPAEAPIAGYDDLTAEQAIAKLPALTQTTLTQLVAYETANQARATVLERIESLREAEPAPGYDALGVAAVQELLGAADRETVARVRDYERRHKSRNGVLQAVERQLGS